MWKAKYLSDTKEEPGLSSKDEATGMDLHHAVARHLPSAHKGEVPMQLPEPQPTPQPRAPTATSMYGSPVFLNWSPATYFNVIYFLTVQSPVTVTFYLYQCNIDSDCQVACTGP